jgi:hypothetical protein
MTLDNVAKILWQLAIDMEKDNPTDICFGFDSTHLSTKGKISMSLEYIERTIKKL